nr:hypothetical protein [uncultured Desulfobulbus sp.]
MKKWVKPFFMFFLVNIINFTSTIPCNISFAGEITWQETAGPQDSCVISIVIDPLNPSIIYAGTLINGAIEGITCSGKGVYKSIDGGKIWSPINIGLPENSLTYMLALAPTNPATLYVATATQTHDGIFRSTNGGETWSPINNGLTTDGRHIHVEPIIDPSMPSTIYIGTEDGIFKSTNAGDSWFSANNGMPLTEILIQAIDPVNPSVLYASPHYEDEEGYHRDGGLYKTIDGGANWQPVNNGLPDITTSESNVNAISIDPINRQIVYAGTDGGGVFKSTNGGESWGPFNNGLANKCVLEILINPASPAELYIGTWGDGVFCTVDGGGNWRSGGLLNSIVAALVFDPSSPSIIYAGKVESGVVKGVINKATLNNSIIPMINLLLDDPS